MLITTQQSNNLSMSILYLTNVDPEGQQNSRRRSLTKHYDVILIE